MCVVRTAVHSRNLRYTFRISQSGFSLDFTSFLSTRNLRYVCIFVDKFAASSNRLYAKVTDHRQYSVL